MLKSLVLSGNNINEWAQLWNAPPAPHLLRLKLYGTESAPLELSHGSTLFIHRLIYVSPLVDFVFQNIELQERHDWIPIVESLDFSSMAQI